MDEVAKLFLNNFLCLLAVIIIELVWIGYQRSSLKVFLASRTTRTFDSVSFFLVSSGIERSLLNLLVLGGLVALNKQVRFYSFNLFALIESYSFILAVVASLLIYDFFIYVSHFCKHRFDLLWIGHRFHHATTELTAFATFRGHILDFPWRLVSVSLPTLFVCGFSFKVAFGVFFFENISQILTHSKINTGYGWFGRIFTSPQMHRRHHSDVDSNCNYGLIFSFWDRIFGTYKPGDQAFAMPTGVADKEYEAKGFVRAYLGEFKALGQYLKNLFRGRV